MADLSNTNIVLNSMTARGIVANGGITVTNKLYASAGSYLTVDGDLTIDSHTKVDFCVASGNASSKAWFPVAAAGGTITVPSRLRAVNGGESIAYANAYVADGVLYMRPASSMLMVIIR